MGIGDTLIVLVIFMGIGFIIYTKVKDQDLRDTYDEVVELFKGKEVIFVPKIK